MKITGKDSLKVFLATCIAIAIVCSTFGVFFLIDSNSPINLTYSEYSQNDIPGKISETNKENYSEMLSSTKELIPRKLDVFPTGIYTENSSIFWYIEEYKIIDSVNPFYRCELFLENENDAETFSKEIDRLGNITGYNGETAVFVNDLFSLDSCVLTYNKSSKFEYALIDYDNLIIRYFYLFDVGDHFVFSKEYAPSKRLKDSSFPKKLIKGKSFDIY